MQLQGHKIEVDSFIRYSADRNLPRMAVDWAAYNIRMIAKNEPITHNHYMKISGIGTVITPATTQVCLDELMRQCAAHIIEKIPHETCALVPVPNSQVDASVLEYKTLDHVKAIASFDPDRIKPAWMLHWRTPQQKAHTGGRSRSYQEHIQNLVVRGRTNRDIVLYDDVVTSGSQLLASKLKLEEAGFRVIGMLTIISVLTPDGVTRSDIGEWRTEARSFG